MQIQLSNLVWRVYAVCLCHAMAHKIMILNLNVNIRPLYTHFKTFLSFQMAFDLSLCFKLIQVKVNPQQQKIGETIEIWVRKKMFI